MMFTIHSLREADSHHGHRMFHELARIAEGRDDCRVLGDEVHISVPMPADIAAHMMKFQMWSRRFA